MGSMKRDFAEGKSVGRDGTPVRPPSLRCDEPSGPTSFFLSAALMRVRSIALAPDVDSFAGSSRSDSHSASRSLAICFIVLPVFADCFLSFLVGGRTLVPVFRRCD